MPARCGCGLKMTRHLVTHHEGLESQVYYESIFTSTKNNGPFQNSEAVHICHASRLEPYVSTCSIIGAAYNTAMHSPLDMQIKQCPTEIYIIMVV